MTRSNQVGLSSRLAKLRAMSPGEVIGRAQYRLTTIRERRQHRLHKLVSTNNLEPVLVARLRNSDWKSALLLARRSRSNRFFAGAENRMSVGALFESRFGPQLRDTLIHAARARENRFEFFGQEFRYDDEIGWQADPVTGQEWPHLYHGDVPVHGGDVGYGDVKYVWELSRQQYLIDLAKAFYLADSTEDLHAMRGLVRSWISGNPYGIGVNWACALEPAFRAWSWLWAYHLTAAQLDDEFHLEWLRGFYDHGRFLARHLEYYSSPYNHLIGEASALYALGVCFPEFREASQWRRLGRSVLEERLADQFYADGGSVEQSTFYHHATTGFYILAAVLGRSNGEELRAPVWRAIERAVEFSMQLAQPDGRTPEIGGADDGKPIRMEHLPFWDFRPYQAIGAVLFGRPDFKMTAGRFYEDALWLLGPDGLAAFDALEQRPPQQISVVLEASGYAVSRSSWAPDADYVCFDVGEQAAGMRTDAVPNSMHGHADCLSLIACLGGRRVLVDAGLYAYNCGGEWEAHFRETAAHNTARIDGCDQAKHIGKMAWSHSYRASVHDRMTDERQAWIVGSHDGYARGPEGVTHSRAIWRRPGGYLLIHDEFTGRGRHEIEINYQFAPGKLQTTSDGRALFDGFAEMIWIANGEWRDDARCGGLAPSDGWICSSLGVRQPAPRLTLTGSLAGQRTSMLSVLAHGAGRVSVVRDGGSCAVAIVGSGYVDWITARGVTCSPAISTDARLAVCRIGAGGEVERPTVQGSYIRIDDAALERLAGLLTPVGAR